MPGATRRPANWSTANVEAGTATAFPGRYIPSLVSTYKNESAITIGRHHVEQTVQAWHGKNALLLYAPVHPAYAAVEPGTILQKRISLDNASCRQGASQDPAHLPEESFGMPRTREKACCNTREGLVGTTSTARQITETAQFPPPV